MQGGNGGAEGLRPTKLYSTPQVMCLYWCAWAPSWAAGGTVTPHFHLHLISCCVIPCVSHSEGRTHTLTDHFILFSMPFFRLAYLAPTCSSHKCTEAQASPRFRYHHHYQHHLSSPLYNKICPRVQPPSLCLGVGPLSNCIRYKLWQIGAISRTSLQRAHVLGPALSAAYATLCMSTCHVLFCPQIRAHVAFAVRSRSRSRDALPSRIVSTRHYSAPLGGFLLLLHPGS